MKKEGKKPVFFYEQELYVLSNFSSFEVKWKGKVWKTSEYAYQAAKFKDEEIIKEIRDAQSSHDAMKIAKIKHKDKKRKDWYDVKLQIMEDILKAKLSQHPYIQKKLLQTDDRKLVENSPKDTFWGWGPNKDGKNHLGKIWMKLRNDLQYHNTSELMDNHKQIS